MQIIREVRAILDSKCSTWGCPQGDTLYDNLHPCAKSLCQFREYIETGATELQWHELKAEVDAIHAPDWPKMLARAYRARVPEIPCFGIFYYRGGIHTAEKAARLIEKINKELDNAVIADPSIARNYFVRAEAMIKELKAIKKNNISVLIVAIMVVFVLIVLVYILTAQFLPQDDIGM